LSAGMLASLAGVVGDEVESAMGCTISLGHSILDIQLLKSSGFCRSQKYPYEPVGLG
jgi:hypothetical protein